MMKKTGFKDINGDDVYVGDKLIEVVVMPEGYEDYDGNRIDTTPEPDTAVLVEVDGKYFLDIDGSKKLLPLDPNEFFCWIKA